MEGCACAWRSDGDGDGDDLGRVKVSGVGSERYDGDCDYDGLGSASANATVVERRTYWRLQCGPVDDGVVGRLSSELG